MRRSGSFRKTTRLRRSRNIRSEKVGASIYPLLFGFDSGAALATLVGVLIEVPVMLSVVKIVNATSAWYGRRPGIPSYAECCPTSGIPSGG